MCGTSFRSQFLLIKCWQSSCWVELFGNLLACSLLAWLVGSLLGWLVGWFAAWLVGWLVVCGCIATAGALELGRGRPVATGPAVPSRERRQRELPELLCGAARVRGLEALRGFGGGGCS